MVAPGHVRNISEYYPKLDYNRFLPHPLQFSIHYHRHHHYHHPLIRSSIKVTDSVGI